MFRRQLDEEDEGIDPRHPAEARHELLWLIVGVVMPNWLAGFLSDYLRPIVGSRRWTWIGLFTLFQWSLATLAWILLYMRLAQRSFLPRPSS